MFFIKKLFLGLAAVVLIYLGGSGTQSSNMLFQGGGFIGIIVGLVVLYIFGKMVGRSPRRRRRPKILRRPRLRRRRRF